MINNILRDLQSQGLSPTGRVSDRHPNMQSFLPGLERLWQAVEEEGTPA